MSKRKERASADLAADTADVVRKAAARSAHVARRLVRRTRLLGRRQSAAAPPPAGVEAPPSVQPPQRGVMHPPAHDELATLRARAERAESAAAWLRARLRAERRKGAAQRIDAAALVTDLTRELSRLRTLDQAAVGRVVQRALAAQGLLGGPLDATGGESRRASPDTSVTVTGWPRELEEALCRRVVQRTPEVADPAYVRRALELIARRGRATVPDLLRLSGLGSALARRRLRLAVETLAALGALTLRDGAYMLTPNYRLPRGHDRAAPREPRNAARGHSERPRRP